MKAMQLSSIIMFFHISRSISGSSLHPPLREAVPGGFVPKKTSRREQLRSPIPNDIAEDIAPPHCQSEHILSLFLLLPLSRAFPELSQDSTAPQATSSIDI